MSAWETSIKVHLGKRTVDAPSAEAFFEEQMRANAFTYLPIAPAHVFRPAYLRALTGPSSKVSRW
jgi:PIN domain nuclease of toxin-antitoxin system